MTFYKTNNGMTDKQSILIIGATGVAGLQCLRKIANHPSQPQVHAFCRNPSKLSAEDRALCTSVIKGDVSDTASIAEALRKTQANLVILTIGNGKDLGKTKIRTMSGRALVDAMVQPEFQHVHAVVVSSQGAGDSRIIVGFGIGSLISHHLRHVLEDHTGQEEAFNKVKSRTLIVRATAFVDDKPTGKTVEFGPREKSPTIQIDREDLAAWIASEVTSDKPVGGKVVHLTGAKRQ